MGQEGMRPLLTHGHLLEQDQFSDQGITVVRSDKDANWSNSIRACYRSRYRSRKLKYIIKKRGGMSRGRELDSGYQ